MAGNPFLGSADEGTPSDPASLMRPPPDLTIPGSSIPAVAAQPTARGRTMRVGPLTTAGVLVGYGDYDANTGPIDVLAVSTSGTVTTLLAAFDTEQIGLSNPSGPDLCGYRVLNGGAIWCPSVDPLSDHEASLATNVGGTTWHTIPVTLAGTVVEHMPDVAQEANGDLYVCGSHAPDTAFVACSTDGGATWTEVLAYATGQSDGYNRFYDLRRKDGKLAVVSSHRGGYYVRQDDGSWTFTAGFTTYDAQPTLISTSDGETRVTVPGRGVVARFADTKTVSVTEVGDGSIWVSDGDTLYYLPAPD